MITLGKISGVFGIKGWVKVYSSTATREAILDYSPWLLKVGAEWKAYTVINGQIQGKAIVAQLDGVDNRDLAEKLVGCTVAISREQLKPLRNNEYYWADLLGLEVVNTQGQAFGKVDSLFETGSNDVLVVQGERERLVPWIMHQVIRSVDLNEKRIVVDWDADF
jgi:16S rRNA processing protein RimM